MKKIILVLVMAFVLFSFGCAQKGGTVAPEKVEYHKGTSGLVITFMENAPPDEIRKLSDFIIGLELKNEGADDIDFGLITISGFISDYILPFQVVEEISDFQGRSPANPTGDYEIMQFKFSNIGYPEGKPSHEETFKITAIYPYETEATAVVCVDPEIYGVVKSICQVGEVSLKGGQGAPVEVTRVDGSSIPTNGDIDVSFDIYFRNAGKGKIRDDKIYVDDNAVMLAGEKLKCENIENGEFELRKGLKEYKLTCFTKVKKTQGAYTAPLIIRLGYVYEQEEWKTLTIKG
jgi:hypothetical protein